MQQIGLQKWVVTNKKELIVYIQKLEDDGELNPENIEVLNNNLLKSGYDFQVYYVEILQPYYSHFFEVQNTADLAGCKIQKRKVNSIGKLAQINQFKEHQHDRVLSVRVIKKDPKKFGALFLWVFAQLFGHPRKAVALELLKDENGVIQIVNQIQEPPRLADETLTKNNYK